MRIVRAPMSSTQQETSTKEVEVIDLLRQLLARGDHDGVIDLVLKLMSTHEKQLRSLLERARKQSTKNEGTSSAQLSLLVDALKKMAAETPDEANAALAAVAPVPPPPPGPKLGPKVRPPRRRSLPPLEEVDNPIKVPDAERPCPICGIERKCIGHETTQVLDIVPAKAIIRNDRREKLACEEHGEVTTAPLGDKVIPGGAYGSMLVADMFVSKYNDGLPLSRLRQRYERLGLDLPSSSMCDQIAWATELLAPISDEIINEILDCEVMHLDGTSLAALDRDDPKGIKIGCLWGYVGVRYRVEDGVARQERLGAYLYTSTSKARARKPNEIGPADMLEIRRERNKPAVVADADGRFDESFKKPGLDEIGCRVGGEVALPAPHRSGRAGFPHPVLHATDSLAAA
jgi:transposase